MSNNNSADQLTQPYEMILNKQDQLAGASSRQQINQSVNYSLDQQNMLQDDGNGQGSSAPGGQGPNTKSNTIQIRNSRLVKNPSYGRLNRPQANSQLQVNHAQELQQPQKLKNGQIGLYYKNRPSQNINSFQLRNSVGQRNERNGGIASGSTGRPTLANGAGTQQGVAPNTNASSQPDLRLQPSNPYIPKRNYALNYSVPANGGSLGNLNSAGHLVSSMKGAGGVNLRDQFTKQRSMINQQSNSPALGERAAANNSNILGVQSLNQKQQYQSNKYY